MIEETQVDCPYCGEGFETAVDCSAGSCDYIEDCPICCRPIEFHAEVDGTGALLTISTRRDDD